MEESIPYKSLLDHISDGVYFVDPKREILFWNRGAEQITGYSKQEVMGKHCWDNILVHVDGNGNNMCQGMCPIAKAIKTRDACETEAFLHHKKGHRVPVLIKTVPIFDKENEPIGAVELFMNNSHALDIKQRLKSLESLALLDPLTGISNRRHIDMVMESKFNQKERYDWNFGLVFLDIDNFKSINDEHGHDVGDEVLKMVSRNLLHNSRSLDTPGRWGGEEFIIISDHVDQEQLEEISERLRMLVESSVVHCEAGDIKITISIGATLALSEDTSKTLLKRVDTLMYQSKEAGKNKVTFG